MYSSKSWKCQFTVEKWYDSGISRMINICPSPKYVLSCAAEAKVYFGRRRRPHSMLGAQIKAGLALSAPRGQTLSSTVHARTPTCITCLSARSLLQASLTAYWGNCLVREKLNKKVRIFCAEMKEGVKVVKSIFDDYFSYYYWGKGIWPFSHPLSTKQIQKV